MIQDVFVVVDWTDDCPRGELVDAMARDACHASHLEARMLHHAPSIRIAGSVAKNLPQEQQSVVRLPHHTVVGQGIILGKLSSLVHPRADSVLELESADGLFNILAWDSQDCALTVHRDALGANPLYYWADASRFVVSSTLKGFRLVPFISSRLDSQSLASYLVTGYRVDSRTLLEGVREFNHGGMTRLHRDGVTFTQSPSLRFAGHEGLSEREQAARVNASLESATRKWLRGADTPVVSLSGGLDSRLALGYVDRYAPGSTASTWGDGHGDDFRRAVQLARSANTAHSSCIIPTTKSYDCAALHLASWVAECFGVANVPFYGPPWVEFLRAREQPVVHGFIGDALGGAHLGDWGTPKENMLLSADAGEETVARWARTRAPNALLRLATPAFRTHLTEGLANDFRTAYRALPGELVYQRLLGFDLYYRQGRGIARSVSKLLHAYLPVVLPFYTRSNIDEFLALPFESLHRRRLSRMLLRWQFPKLARVREADTGRLVAPSSRAVDFIDRLLRNRYTYRVIPGLRPVPSTDFIGRLIVHNREVLTRTVRSASPLFADHIDSAGLEALVAACHNNTSARTSLMRLFNVSAFLVHYFDLADERTAQMGAPISI